MSRAFVGGEQITVTPSPQVPVNEGNFTLMALVKQSITVSNDHWIVQAYNASNSPCWGILSSGGKFYNEGNFGPGNLACVLNSWIWVGFTKGSGSVAPRWHTKNLTAGTAWTHVNDSSNVGDQPSNPVVIVVGGRQAISSNWQGSIAAIAAWTGVLTDADIESAALSAQALKSSGPEWGVLLDQTSTATPVTDLSGNGATQASIIGTSIDSDNPPGWSYSLVTGPTITVWNGTSEVPASVTVWNGTSEVAASVSSIA